PFGPHPKQIHMVDRAASLIRIHQGEGRAAHRGRILEPKAASDSPSQGRFSRAQCAPEQYYTRNSQILSDLKAQPVGFLRRPADEGGGRRYVGFRRGDTPSFHPETTFLNASGR